MSQGLNRYFLIEFNKDYSWKRVFNSRRAQPSVATPNIRRYTHAPVPTWWKKLYRPSPASSYKYNELIILAQNGPIERNAKMASLGTAPPVWLNALFMFELIRLPPLYKAGWYFGSEGRKWADWKTSKDLSDRATEQSATTLHKMAVAMRGQCNSSLEI